jgi:hypothetical protein
MPAKTVSAHVAEALRRIEQVQPLDGTQRIQAISEMYRVFERMKDGVEIIPPLYPDTNKVIPIFEEYRKSLKPSDILDDQPGPFPFDY